MHRALALVPLLLAAPLAGCLGSDDPQPTNTSVPETTAPLPVAQAGDIVGTVVDPTQVPIGGAEVFLLRNDSKSATVARDGSYAMTRVEPGEHLVRAEATGFLGETFLVRVKSGQVTELEIVLRPEPELEPSHQTRELEGLIDCAVVVASADSPTRPTCVNYDENARMVFDVEVPPDPVRVLIEVLWEPDTPFSERMAVDAQTVGLGPQDADLGDTEGASVLRLDIPPAVVSRYFADAGKLRINVTVAPSVGDEEGVALGLAFQQQFTLLITTFFVEPGAPDFSALGDA